MAAAPAQADEAARDNWILVSASRANQPLASENYTGSVTVLSASDLQDRQTRDIADILRDVPGVAVGGTPGLTQLRLRGSEANHVLILADGIELSNPFYGETDIGTLQAEPGARIEVLRGPQSALYGSDAIGGVVAYQSASGCERTGFGGYGEAGSHATVNGSSRLGLCGEGSDLAMTATWVSTDGAPNAIDGARDIGRDSLTLSGKGSVEIAPGAELHAAARFLRTEGDFNNQDFDPTSPTFGYVIDSPGYRYENEAIYGLLGARFGTLEGRWTHDLSGQLADVQRDTFGPFERESGNVGQRLKASYVSSIGFGGPDVAHRLTVAADYERERYRNTDPSGYAFVGARSASNVGLVGEYRFESPEFDLSAALRHDVSNRFADATTFRLAGGARIASATRLRAAGGSGIKNPGFYELYGYVDGRFIGNPGLRPEKSEGWEVGIDQSFAKESVRLSATWFEETLKHEIFTAYPPPDFTATPANRASKSARRGLEFALRADLGRGWSLDAAYSWLDAEEDGTSEVRRPGDIASLVLSWQAPGDRFSATIAVRYNGETDDLAFTDPSFVPVRTTLEDFTLVGLNAAYRLSERVELFGRIENLLDEEYQQVFGFVSPGRTAVGGVRVAL